MSGEVVIVLRIFHIVGGALWVGSAIFYLLFVDPVVNLLGPAKPKFMQGLIEQRRYPLFMNAMSAFTIVAGALLLWNTSGGLQGAWFQTRAGLGFTIGSVAALLAYLVGFLMVRPRAGRMGALGKQIGMTGGPPTPEQAAELHKLEQELGTFGRLDAILLTIALVTMATARYW